jgi:L-alanine-DL-glutamate epimerase-like enolase superfamily enzyme
MKITGFELGMLRVPLKTPFRTALRTVEEIADVVVVLHTDSGHVGHGGAPATAAITGDTHASIIDAIRHHLGPALVGAAVDQLHANCQRLHAAIAGNPSAKAAMEIALYDLWGQLHQAPLYQLLGGGTPLLESDITISVDTPAAMADQSLQALARGYGALKIKIGTDPALDIARVQAVAAAVAGRARLRLDANQGWSAVQAVEVMQVLEGEGLQAELLEQPVKADDLDGLAYVSQRIRTPVMADESVFDPRQAMELLRRGAASILNIKLMKAGGLSRALRIADIAAEHGVRCMIGCMLESAIPAAAAAHLAVARSGVVSLVDLDGPALARYNPVRGGVAFDGPQVRLGTGAGLGIEAVPGLEPVPA